MLSNIIMEDTQDMTLEQIAEVYGESLNPALLALAFKKTHKLIMYISRNYYGLTEEDIASFSLEKLDDCLLTYKKDQASFSTYFTRTLHNKFREETQALNTHKRKAIFFSDSYEAMLEDGFDLIACAIEEDNFIETLQEYNLTTKELQYCELLLNGWTNKDISEKMEVSVMTLSNMRKKLRLKLAPMAL